MSYIHSLSYTRSVSRNFKAGENIALFGGSSLNREQKTKKEAKEQTSTNDDETGLQQEIGNLYANKEGELVYNESEPNELPRLRSLPLTHSLSRRSKNKIRDKIYALYGATAGTDFTFLTLTFISNVSDKLGQKVLNKFLTVLRDEYGRFFYLWVAERQDNNNIHFHVVLNRRFPIERINSLWVLQQYNAGIKHSLYSYDDIIKKHQAHTMQTILNPVDISRIKNINSLAGYVTKYITKNSGEFFCSAWHCCRGVSALFTKSIISNEVAEEVNNTEINYSVNKRTGEVFEAKQVEIKDKTGNTVAFVTHILNREYYRKHLKFMEGINELIASSYLKQKNKEEFVKLRKDFNETIRLDADEYVNIYHKGGVKNRNQYCKEDYIKMFNNLN